MWRLGLAIALCFQISATLAGEASLAVVLAQFEQRGLTFVYSRNVVDDNLQVTWDARPGASVTIELQRLQQLLEQHGFRLRKISAKSWAIVALARPPLPMPEAAADSRLEELVVTASLHEVSSLQGTSQRQLDAADLNQIPAFAGDSLRIVHRLPGAATLGISSRPNIRGGDENEVLVVFDGVELIDPFHLRDFQSMFSSFNPGTIENIDYFTGGFPAQFGNRMSGVMDIAAREDFQEAGAEIGISLFNTSGLLYGTHEDQEWLISGRRGNLDLVLDKVNPRLGKPKYHDLYGKYSRPLGDGTLAISGLVLEDNIRLGTDEAIASSDVTNHNIWLDFESPLAHGLDSETILSLSKIDSIRKGESLLEERAIGTLEDSKDLRVWHVRQLFRWQLNDAMHLVSGFSFRHTRVDYLTRLDVERGDIAPFLDLPETVSINLNRRYTGNNIDLHSTARIRLSPAVTLQLGLRFDRQSYISASQISPRLAVLYTPSSTWTLRFSAGRFTQPQFLHELSPADGETGFAAPQRSDHWIAAVEHQLTRTSKLELEYFFKSMEKLKPRYTNLFNPYVLIPELEPDRFAIRASEAFARGMELTWSGRKDNLNWNLNYTYSQVQDKEGRWIDRRWDQPHSVNAAAGWQFGQFDVNLAAAWHTGWRLTTLNPNNLPEAPVSNFRNNNRLRNFATMDARVSYDIEFNRSNLRIFAEVTNFVNRANDGGVEYEIEETDGGGFEVIESDLEPIFPLVTNLGFVWRW